MITIKKTIIDKNLLKTEVKGFDICNSNNDLNILRKIFETIFKNFTLKTVFFRFRAEDILFFNYDELAYYRNFLPKQFNDNGEYIVVRMRDESMFDSFARLKVDENFYNILLWSWRYFYAMSFFIPNTNLTWEYFVQNYYEFTQKDIDAISIFKMNYIDMICIKGMDGDQLTIVHKKSYILPDIEKNL